MRVVFSAAARRDRREAESHYSSISSRLRAAFRDDLRDALQFIVDYPEGAPVYGVVRSGEVRAKTLITYPYTVFYLIAGRQIFVVGVANQAREPLEAELKILLQPKDPNDDKNVFVEHSSAALEGTVLMVWVIAHDKRRPAMSPCARQNAIAVTIAAIVAPRMVPATTSLT